MLFGNKEKVIRLHAENFLWGNLTIDYGKGENERFGWIKNATTLSQDLQSWLRCDAKNDLSEEHKTATNKLYSKILGWRIRGRLQGILQDIDMEQENLKLKDENMRFKLQNEKLKKDNIILARELKDKTDLVEEYEKTAGVRKP